MLSKATPDFITGTGMGQAAHKTYYVHTAEKLFALMLQASR